MAWLITHIWIALAAASLLGLLFGFAFRGLTGSGKVRRAEVDRDVAKTELLQTKSELDALYAAQRKQRESGAQVPAADYEQLQTAFNQRDAEFGKLRELHARSEVEVAELREALEARSGNQTNEADQALQDRNTWLEERVAALEADVSAAASAPTPLPVDTSQTDEELARLRWRNRYLEGRLAYFEEGSDDAEAVVEDTEPSSVAEDTAEEVVADSDLSEEDEGEQHEPAEFAAEPEVEVEEEVSEIQAEAAETEPEDGVVPEDSAQAETSEPDETVHPSDAVLQELGPVGEDVPGEQPQPVDRPSNGGDDLTAINGIGPKIADVLNGLGIWTYAQIAEWSPAHASWVEEHLSFKGRVGREDWVNQAKRLTQAETEEA